MQASYINLKERLCGQKLTALVTVKILVEGCSDPVRGSERVRDIRAAGQPLETRIHHHGSCPVFPGVSGLARIIGQSPIQDPVFVARQIDLLRRSTSDYALRNPRCRPGLAHSIIRERGMLISAW